MLEDIQRFLAVDRGEALILLLTFGIAIATALGALATAFAARASSRAARAGAATVEEMRETRLLAVRPQLEIRPSVKKVWLVWDRADDPRVYPSREDKRRTTLGVTIVNVGTGIALDVRALTTGLKIQIPDEDRDLACRFIEAAGYEVASSESEAIVRAGPSRTIRFPLEARGYFSDHLGSLGPGDETVFEFFPPTIRPIAFAGIATMARGSLPSDVSGWPRASMDLFLRYDSRAGERRIESFNVKLSACHGYAQDADGSHYMPGQPLAWNRLDIEVVIEAVPEGDRPDMGSAWDSAFRASSRG